MKNFLKHVKFLVTRTSLIKSLYYSLKFKSQILVGRGTKINLHNNSRIVVNSGTLKIGCSFSLPFRTVVDIYSNGALIINGNVQICKGTKVMIGKNANLTIGNNSYINENSRIQCRKEIEIGEDCAISWNTHILDTDEHTLVVDSFKKDHIKSIKIGNKVWIGCKSVILKGVEIGDGSIIAAGSIVTKNILPNNLVAGNPAVVIKENVAWL